MVVEVGAGVVECYKEVRWVVLGWDRVWVEVVVDPGVLGRVRRCPSALRDWAVLGLSGDWVEDCWSDCHFC